MIMDKVALLPEIKLTPIQQKIFDVLTDGKQHQVDELLILIDGQADKNNLHWHLNNLRDKIYTSGYLIAAITAGFRGASHYQMVGRLRINMD